MIPETWDDLWIGWTIYKYPKDYPDRYVVRAWTIGDEGEVVFNPEVLVLSVTLEEAREYLPVGLIRVERDPEDDPVIVETWL